MDPEKSGDSVLAFIEHVLRTVQFNEDWLGLQLGIPPPIARCRG